MISRRLEACTCFSLEVLHIYSRVWFERCNSQIPRISAESLPNLLALWFGKFQCFSVNIVFDVFLGQLQGKVFDGFGVFFVVLTIQN